MDGVTESVEHTSPVQKVRSLNPSSVKPMTYKIDTCHCLAWCLKLIGQMLGYLVMVVVTCFPWCSTIKPP